MSSKSNRLKYLFKNTLIFALGNVGTKLISFFLVPLYTNYLLDYEYGTVDLVLTLGTFIVPIMIFNINEAIMRFSLDKNADQNAIMSTGILSLFSMMILATGAYPLIQFYEPLAPYRLYVYLYFISSGFSTVFLYNLRGKEQLVKFSIGSIINAFITAGLNILFLTVFKWGIDGFLLSYIISNFITAIFAFFASDVINSLKHFKFDYKLTKNMLKYSILLIPNSFMWWIMSASSRVMITAMIGIGSVGLYSVANKLPSIISVVSTVFNQAWNYSAIKEDNSNDRESFNNTTFHYLLAGVCLCGAVLSVFIKPIMSVYVDKSYFSAWFFTPPLIFGTCILVLSSFLSSQYTVNKDSKGFLLSAIVGAVVNIGLSFILIPQIGELGASLATCISYCAVFIYRIIDIRKYIHIKVFTLKHVLTFVLLIISTVIVYFDKFTYMIGIVAILLMVLLYLKDILFILNSIIKKIKSKKNENV